MPDVKIYIRSEDWNKWQAISNKPEWLHTHLNEDDLTLKEVKQSFISTSEPIIKVEYPHNDDPTYEPMEPAA